MTDTTLTIAELAKMQADCGTPHLPTQETYWFRKAMSGEGPHAFDWTDKPHRLVFDLCRMIETQAARATTAEASLATMREALEPFAKLGKIVLAEAPSEARTIVMFTSVTGEKFAMQLDYLRNAIRALGGSNAE